ncbi:MAG: CHASE2 domain-containing protein [Okeania sp. SIO3I5]|uniref:CHASE2 domain-containing protein n=1 Tax=Okeania sp. SIO3I5 TaxID=2607805 RepID=UPI0013B66963|nr:CHASE2 domain-containing protein [Okeania sp. SIO3I5]NEQ35306.1 CHASE2 domain-containing protein [Okeania sp. SIO3I5]
MSEPIILFLLLTMKYFNLEVEITSVNADNLDKQNCSFKLSWQDSRRLSATLKYPTKLIENYARWQNAYHNYYTQNSRGKVIDEGDIPAPEIDWLAKLNEEQKTLVTEFNEWLRDKNLYDIREEIKNATNKPNSHWIDIFLSCNSEELARLPWEAWEISGSFGASGKIRISRTPTNILEKPVQPIRRKARILTIIGDDNCLNFQADREAVKSLSQMTNIQFIGWQPGVNIDELKNQIWQAIADSNGWDILFFAGHSDETNLTGGQFSIAPGVFVSINQLENPLKIAIKNGLQAAIFNSCQGISIAESLISLGLTQVVVMRELIHNKVAHEFIINFTQSLAAHKDIHEALLDTCRIFCQTEKSLTYPSAYLIPSLFRRPNSELFKIEPFGFKQWLKSYLPTTKEAIVLLSFLIIAWQLPMQQFLLDWRIFVQAIYRQLTGQNLTNKTPPVLLVEIDNESIRKAKITDTTIMDRGYLAKLVEEISQSEAKIIGIDYLLDRFNGGESDRLLATALQTAVKKQKWIVFAKYEYGVNSEFASLNWSLEGDMTVLGDGRYLTTIDFSGSNDLTFASMLALVYQLNNDNKYNDLLLPNLESKNDLFNQLSDYLEPKKVVKNEKLFSPAARLNLLTILSYWLRQMWLHPIVDFSISYDQVYDSIPAWQILESNNSLIRDKIKEQVVIIAPGGYENAGVKFGEDNIEHPPIAFRDEKLTGGKIHAYLLHHFLTNRLVVPIPDLWMILMAAFLGKSVILILNDCTDYPQKHNRWVVVFAVGNLGYLMVSLQVYISGAILLPILSPSAIFWIYFLLNKRMRSHGLCHGYTD